MLKINNIYLGDCLEVMKSISDKSIDMILCDLPYGTTACKWDIIIPFEPLWNQYKRIIKDNAPIVLTGSQPFTSKLIVSNIEMFRYEWIWEKGKATGHTLCKKRPLKSHENILVFYKNQPKYNPIMGVGEKYKGRNNIEIYKKPTEDWNIKHGARSNNNGTRFPRSIFKISNVNIKGMHPTQKPVALFEYLIKTYTNEGDLVLDNCIGSGTTAIACINTKRNFIGIEKDINYFKMSNKRISETI